MGYLIFFFILDCDKYLGDVEPESHTRRCYDVEWTSSMLIERRHNVVYLVLFTEQCDKDE